MNKKACGLVNDSTNNVCIILSGLSLPFSWEAMWIASIFYLCSYVVYLLFCPDFVRKYKNIENYISKSLPHRNIIHEWSDFIGENRKILIENRDFFQKLNDSSFCSSVSIKIKTETELNDLYIREYIVKNESGFLLSPNESFTIYGNFNGSTLIFNYSSSQKESDMKKNEDYKEISLSLFDVSEKFRITYKAICYFLIFISSLLFLFILYQNIFKTASYIFQSM